MDQDDNTVIHQSSRILAYAEQTREGITVDIEGMMIDAIMSVVASGRSKEDFMRFVSTVWDGMTIIPLPAYEKERLN